MKIFKLLYKYYYDININRCIIFISLIKCIDNIKLTYYNKNIIKMIGELTMTSLLKKLFITGLVACSICAATTSVTYANEKPTIDEIEVAKFGGYNNAISGEELNNPYNKEVEPELYEVYETFYQNGTLAKNDGEKDPFIALFEHFSIERKKLEQNR